MHGGRRWAATVACALLAASVAVSGTAAPAGALPADALLIGDSVMNALAQPYGAPARALLQARHPVVLDTAGCRRLITTSCSIGTSKRPTNAITALRARAGQYDRTLVVGAGYNDDPSGPAGVAAAVDALLAEAEAQGIDDVVWLTYREAGTAGNIARFKKSNAVLHAKAAQYPALRVVDWNARSQALPSSWFSGDGIHLGSDAAAAMAAMIADALDDAPPTRCDAPLWIGASPITSVGGATVGAGPAGGMHLLAEPVRLLDTRTEPGKVGAGRVVAVPVAGQHGVPVDATAAIVSVVAVAPCGDAYLTVFPCGTAPPGASTVNAAARDTVANSAVVALGGGALCVFASQPADVVVDVSGYVAAGGAGTTALAPRRIVDTRAGEGQLLPVAQVPVPGGQGITVDVGAATGVALDAATVNLTAAAPAAEGFLSVTPGACSGAVPSTSVLNVRAGHDAAAGVTVRLVAGRFCVYASVTTDVVVDLQAVHDAGASAGVAPVAPQRMYDSRSVQRMTAGEERRLAAVVPAAHNGVVVNATVVSPDGNGYASVYPCGGERPFVSTVNAARGATVANRAIVAAGRGGDICVYASVAMDVVVDAEAWLTG
jgi:hypothetical protein